MSLRGELLTSFHQRLQLTCQTEGVHQDGGSAQLCRGDRGCCLDVWAVLNAASVPVDCMTCIYHDQS